MNNIIGGTFSTSVYIALAFWQTISVTELALVKDLGMGGAFIVTVIFIIKYFVGQIKQKDADNKEMMNQVMQMSEKFIESNLKTESILQDVVQELRKIS